MSTDQIINFAAIGVGILLVVGMFWMQFRFVFQSGWLRVRIIGGNEESFMVRVRGEDTFTMPKLEQTFNIATTYQIRGKWNIPIQYYRRTEKGILADPIDIADLRPDDETTARDYFERTESHVASDAINSLKRGGFTVQQSFTIVLVAIIAVGGVLWWQNGESENKLISAINAENNVAPFVATPTPTGNVIPSNNLGSR